MAKRPKWVQETVDRINQWLKDSPDELRTTWLVKSKDQMQARREGMAEALAQMLMTHNSYRGFQYLPSAGMEKDANGLVTFKDESRRQYI